MRNLKLVLGLVSLTLVVVFSIQNAELLQVNFLIWSFEMRRALLLFLVLAVGILIGWAAHSFKSASGKDREDDLE